MGNVGDVGLWVPQLCFIPTARTGGTSTSHPDPTTEPQHNQSPLGQGNFIVPKARRELTAAAVPRTGSGVPAAQENAAASGSRQRFLERGTHFQRGRFPRASLQPPPHPLAAPPRSAQPLPPRGARAASVSPPLPQPSPWCGRHWGSRQGPSPLCTAAASPAQLRPLHRRVPRAEPERDSSQARAPLAPCHRVTQSLGASTGAAGSRVRSCCLQPRPCPRCHIPAGDRSPSVAGAAAPSPGDRGTPARGDLEPCPFVASRLRGGFGASPRGQVLGSDSGCTGLKIHRGGGTGGV